MQWNGRDTRWMFLGNVWKGSCYNSFHVDFQKGGKYSFHSLPLHVLSRFAPLPTPLTALLFHAEGLITLPDLNGKFLNSSPEPKPAIQNCKTRPPFLSDPYSRYYNPHFCFTYPHRTPSVVRQAPDSGWRQRTVGWAFPGGESAPTAPPRSWGKRDGPHRWAGLSQWRAEPWQMDLVFTITTRANGFCYDKHWVAL